MSNAILFPAGLSVDPGFFLSGGISAHSKIRRYRIISVSLWRAILILSNPACTTSAVANINGRRGRTEHLPTFYETLQHDL